MTMDRYVLEALQKKAITAVGVSVPLKCVGIAFQPPVSGRWWEVLWIPNNPTGETWDSAQTYRGMFRLVLHTPIDGKGAYSILDEVNRIAANFSKGTKLTDSGNNVIVLLVDNPEFIGLFETTPESEAFLSIRYTCFKP